MTTTNIPDTQEFALQTAAPAAVLSAAVQVDVGGLSHTGKVRSNNEDHFLIARYGRFLEPLHTNLPAEQAPGSSQEIGYAMVVADGMGGHPAGEEASKLAITNLVQLALTTPDWILRLDDPSFAEEVMRRASERFSRVDQLMAEQAEGNANLQGFGTTMTFAASLGKDLFVAHLGDSRAYLFRKSQMHQITRDHTLVRSMADAGLINPQQIATHHLRHLLTKSLGRDERIQPDVERLSLEDADRLLLCTDGLTDMLKDEEIAEILATGKAAQYLCEQLIDRALHAGGRDNVTAIVAGYRLPQVQ